MSAYSACIRWAYSNDLVSSFISYDYLSSIYISVVLTLPNDHLELFFALGCGCILS